MRAEPDAEGLSGSLPGKRVATPHPASDPMPRTPPRAEPCPCTPPPHRTRLTWLRWRRSPCSKLELNSHSASPVAKVPFRVAGNELHLAIPRDPLPIRWSVGEGTDKTATIFLPFRNLACQLGKLIDGLGDPGLPRLARLCHNPKSPFSERSGNENQRLDVGIAPPMPIIRAERAMVSVHLLPSLIPPGGLHGGVAVVIDVLRASTMMVHALVAGCTAVMPCGEVDEARRLAASLPAGSSLLAGERHGVAIEGFDLGNSPGECTPAVCQGKTMVITTTNGTRALLACLDADPVVVGSFVNFAATSQRLLHEARPIHLVSPAPRDESAMRTRSWPGPLPSTSRTWTTAWPMTRPRSRPGSGPGSKI